MTTYVKVLDDLEDHPRWQEFDLLPEALGLWVLALAYCGRNQTDGHFPGKLPVRRWAGSQGAIGELVAAGRWHEPGHDCAECPQPAEGQFYVHAYLDHQRSREQIAELSEKRREAGRQGGKTRAENHGARQVAKQAKSNAVAAGSNGQADSTHSTEYIEQKNNTPTAVAAEFESWWEMYPRKIGKAAAAKAYARARRDVDTLVLVDGLANATQVWKATQTEAQFIPHAATWLNAGRWADEVPLPNMPGGQPEARPVTLHQCNQPDPHPRHLWRDDRNRYGCQGVEA